MVIKKVKEWIGSLPFLEWDRDVEVVFESELEDRIRLRIYTETNVYKIYADAKYLGCAAASRKPRAGEDWTRGNDLPDGKFGKDTWLRILGAIVGYETVKVHGGQKGKNGSETSNGEGSKES